MEACFRCNRNGKKVRLLDAIYENGMVKVCERCAVTESIPIMRKPSTSQLKEAEKEYTVYQRLKKLAGMEEEKEQGEGVLAQLRRLDENPELEKPAEKKPFNLIDNFHWHVQRERRNKGLSQKQLGWALGESETAVKIIEKGELPEDPEKLIKKLEQFFQTKLRERTEEELEEERRKEEEKEEFRIPTSEKLKVEKESAEPVEPIESMIDEPEIEELDIISEKTKEPEFEEEETETIREKPSPAQVLSFKPEVMKEITVADLKEIKEEKEREDRLAAVEEERKKALQADDIVQGVKDEEKSKRELREKIAGEMKDIALGREKPETVQEKREKLNNALEKTDKTKEKEEKGKGHVPTISELIEKKKEKKQEKLTGSEIELEE